MTICTKLISTWKVQIAKQNKTLSSNHTKTATSPRSRTLSIEKMKIVWNKLSFAFSPFYARFVHTSNLGTFMVDISIIQLIKIKIKIIFIIYLKRNIRPFYYILLKKLNYTNTKSCLEENNMIFSNRIKHNPSWGRPTGFFGWISF